mmetsp:Transcript_68038/g.142074  ORF Transcript_68038/g.142074 Transcript_68038/m.142074 type:complete len:213 (+) Transcript_68038:748-1386(+)
MEMKALWLPLSSQSQELNRNTSSASLGTAPGGLGPLAAKATKGLLGGRGRQQHFEEANASAASLRGQGAQPRCRSSKSLSSQRRPSSSKTEKMRCQLAPGCAICKASARPGVSRRKCGALAHQCRWHSSLHSRSFRNATPGLFVLLAQTFERPMHWATSKCDTALKIDSSSSQGNVAMVQEDEEQLSFSVAAAAADLALGKTSSQALACCHT